MAGENAAASASASENASPQDGGGAAAPVVDFGEILASHQHELARTGKTVEELRSELGKSHGTLDRVRKAFVGDDGEKLTAGQKRVQHFEALSAEMDQVAREHGLPVTTKIGKEFASYAREMAAENEALREEMASMKEAIKRQQNPAFQGLERAAFIMEGMVDDGLAQMYGNDPNARQIRAAQFNAVTARINDEIKDLMQNDPEALLKVQRNPKVMRKMVNHFMSEMLPPKVRTMLNDERIKNEPMSSRDLVQAFAEAREQYEEASSKNDQKKAQHFSNLMTEIRHDILAEQYGGKRGGTAEKPSLNKLFQNSIGGR